MYYFLYADIRASAFKIQYLFWCDHVSVRCACVFHFYSFFCRCCCCYFRWRKIIKVKLCGANLISLFVCAIHFVLSFLFNMWMQHQHIHAIHKNTRFEIIAFQDCSLLKHFRPCDSWMFITHSARIESKICNCLLYIWYISVLFCFFFADV